MNIPDSIKIGGCTYKVEFVENLSRDRNASGQSCMNAQWIKIDNSICQEQKESTFIHEIIEQIDAMNELKLDHQQICTLETAIYQVIKDNAEVFEP